MSYDVVKRRQGRGASLHAAAIAACAVVLSFSGAYDTDELTLAHRLLLFTVIAGLLIAQASLFDSIFRRLVRGEGAIALIRAAMTIGLTLLAMTLEVHALKFTPLLPKAPDPLPAFALFMAPFVIAIAGLVIMLKTPPAARAAMLEPLEIGYERVLELPSHPVIAGLLPPPSPEALADWPSAPVIRVVAQDHYLEVTTASENVLIRGRMKDAVARLGERNGVQPHRSWWVGSDQITGIARRGRDYVLLLSDGSEAPVARARVKTVQNRLKALGVEV